MFSQYCVAVVVCVDNTCLLLQCCVVVFYSIVLCFHSAMLLLSVLWCHVLQRCVAVLCWCFHSVTKILCCCCCCCRVLQRCVAVAVVVVLYLHSVTKIHFGGLPWEVVYQDLYLVYIISTLSTDWELVHTTLNVKDNSSYTLLVLVL